MSESTNPTNQYTSVAALRADYIELFRRIRAGDDINEQIDEIISFIERAREAGSILVNEQERIEVQANLSFLQGQVYRYRRVSVDSVLADFDPELLPKLDDALCPYRGLNSFQEEDQAWFFGRQEQIDECVSVLRKQRLLAVVGPSGSGKSSLVRAGLIPALREEALPSSKGWRYLPLIVPGSHPLQSLARAITSAPDDNATHSEHPNEHHHRVEPSIERMNDLTVSVRDLAHELFRTPTVLVVDQFEELYTLCEDERIVEQFIALLLAVVDMDDVEHRVILTLRSDFDAVIARTPDLQQRFSAARVKVPALGRTDLRHAIEEPGREVGLSFDHGVIDGLLQDILGEPAGLPLLQFTLLQLWHRRERNRITLAAYYQVGGARQALARSADAFYSALIPEDQITARRILLGIVRTGESFEITSKRMRRDVLLARNENPERVNRVLEKLVAAGLVRQLHSTTVDGVYIEMSHEALVRNWPAFVGWIDEERLTLTALHRLEVQAKEWVRFGRGNSGLLDAVELNDARRWVRQAEGDQLLFDPLVTTFLEASRVAILAQQREQEAHVRQLEAINRQLQQREHVINSQRLAFAAQSLAAQEPETALLLACEAAKANDNFITSQALREILDQMVWQPKSMSASAAQILRCAWSGDGQIWAIGDSDGGICIWSVHPEEQLQSFNTGLGPITALAWSPSSSSLAVASGDGTVHICDDHGILQTVLRGHSDSVLSMSFSPDGLQLATASADHTARLWNLDNGAGQVLEGHNGSVTTISYSPNGDLLVTASEDWTARVWKRTGVFCTTLAPVIGASPVENEIYALGAVHNAVFSPDGTMVVTASDDRNARLWSTEGELLRTFVGHTGVVYDAIFSRDGKQIITASEDSTVRIWDISSVSHLVLPGHTGTVLHVSCSPDGGSILSASADGTARIWRLTGAPIAALSGHGAPLNHASFNPNGQWIATISTDGAARVWHKAQLPLPSLAKHSGPVYQAVFSRIGDYILTASADGSARLWGTDGAALTELKNVGHTYRSMPRSNNTRGAEQIIANGSSAGDPRSQEDEIRSSYIGPMNSVCCSPDGNWIVTTSDDTIAWLWPRTGGINASLKGHTSNIQSAEFSPDGTQIVTTSADRTARIWQMDGALRVRMVATLRGHSSMVKSASYSPDGASIVTASVDRTARIWDRRGVELALLQHHRGPVTSARFSQSGAFVVTFSEDGTACIWRRSGELVAALEGHTAAVRSAVFSPDSNYLVTASEDGTARVWSVNGASVSVLSGHTGWILSAVFSSDSQRIVTASVDRTARIWKIGGELDAILTGHSGAVRSAVFSPDSQRVLTASDDWTARQYLVTTQSLLEVAATRVGRTLTTSEMQRFQIASRVGE